MGTHILLGSTTLGSTSSNITFTSLPQDYEDLVLYIRMRTESANNMPIYFNGNTSNYSYTMYRGEATTGYEGSSNGNAAIGTTTSSFATYYFNYYRIYISDYSSTTRYKPFHSIGTEMDNSTFEHRIYSGLWSDTSAITSVGISGNNMVAGTSVRLYGISA